MGNNGHRKGKKKKKKKRRRGRHPDKGMNRNLTPGAEVEEFVGPATKGAESASRSDEAGRALSDHDLADLAKSNLSDLSDLPGESDASSDSLNPVNLTDSDWLGLANKLDTMDGTELGDTEFGDTELGDTELGDMELGDMDDLADDLAALDVDQQCPSCRECQCRQCPSDDDDEGWTRQGIRVRPRPPPTETGPRREWLDFRGYVDSETMRKFGTKQLTQRGNITCFRCGEQGHYRIECLSWRTKMCLHYVRPSGCREGDNCSYAHSEAELRFPWQAKCVRVIKRHGQIFTLGCHSNSHTFKLCPHMACVLCGSRRHWTCDQSLL